jgi:hypothetical protein
MIAAWARACESRAIGFEIDMVEVLMILISIEWIIVVLEN